MKGLIGVLGGMGPAATADIFNKFIQATQASCDQDHLPLLISSIPDIPDRTKALLQGGISPLQHLGRYLHMLEKAGAECIIIPCNTAHFWFDELKKITHCHMISIIDSALNEVARLGKQKIAVLATNATIASELYQKQIMTNGIECLIPDEQSQQQVMASIYALKAGEISKARQLLHVESDKLFSRGAEAIVLGCTEIPLILAEQINQMPDKFVDATAALVRATIRWYQQQSIIQPA